VALNLQTKDVNQLLNQALFENNGSYNCGYLLKTPFLLGLDDRGDQLRRHFDLEIISGHHIPKKPSGDKDIVDPYVAVYLLSTAASEIKLLQTQVVPDNGLNPVWNERCSFSVSDQEINILLVKVHDDDHTLLCWNAFNLELVRQGYRAMEMKSPQLQPLHASTIFCKINIK
jgi:hypothetical protein